MATPLKDIRPPGRQKADARHLLSLQANDPLLPRHAQQDLFEAIIKSLNTLSQEGMAKHVADARGAAALPPESWRQILRYAYYLVEADCFTIVKIEQALSEALARKARPYAPPQPTEGDFGLLRRGEMWITREAGEEALKAEILRVARCCEEARGGLRGAQRRFGKLVSAVGRKRAEVGVGRGKEWGRVEEMRRASEAEINVQRDSEADGARWTRSSRAG